MIYNVIYIRGFGSKGKSNDHTPDQLHWKNKFVIPLLLFLLASYGKYWVGVVQVSISVDKMLYPMLKSDTESYGVVLKTDEKFVAIQHSAPCIYLTFRGPCIVIYSYNKANKMHIFSTLFGKELYRFRTDLLSIIRSLNTVFTYWLRWLSASEVGSIPTSLADS